MHELTIKGREVFLDDKKIDGIKKMNIEVYGFNDLDSAKIAGLTLEIGVKLNPSVALEEVEQPKEWYELFNSVFNELEIFIVYAD